MVMRCSSLTFAFPGHRIKHDQTIFDNVRKRQPGPFRDPATIKRSIVGVQATIEHHGGESARPNPDCAVASRIDVDVDQGRFPKLFERDPSAQALTREELARIESWLAL